MFRRRTDRIYATLQQVQRRITQGTEPGDEQTSLPPTPASGSQTPKPAWGFGPGPTTGYVVTPDGQRHQTQGDGLHSSTPPSTPPSVPSTPPQSASPEGGSQAPSFFSSAPAPSAQPAAATEPASPTSAPSVFVSPPQPERRFSESEMGHQPQVGASVPQSGFIQASQPQPREIANPHLDLVAAEGRQRSVIEIAPGVAFFVLFTWVLTVAGAFFIGYSQGGGSESTGSSFVGGPGVSQHGTNVQAPDVGASSSQRPIAQGSSSRASGDYVLVLQSVAPTTEKAQKLFEDSVRRFNETALKSNFDPLFAVRYPSSGGIQFVYGKDGDVFGIRNDDERAAKIEKALKKKFKDLAWRRVND